MVFDAIAEASESPAFWVLNALGIGGVVMGYIASKRMDLAVLPIWQVGLMILTVFGASVYFANNG